MGVPLKVKIREKMKEILCPHLEYNFKRRMCGTTEFLICECKKCGKTWVIK